MLLHGLQDEGDIAQVAERVINNIEQNVVVHERNFKPQASIGISRYPADGEDARTLMQAGDNAMYAAKNAGHHRFEFFNREMTRKAAERFTLAQELRNAFREQQFLLHYQPQVSIKTGEIHAWEALVRWQHPSRGMVPPGEFVPEIERLGLIKDLGDWALKEATEQIVRWQHDGMTRVRVSVNIAPRHFDDPNLVATVRRSLDDSDLAPWQLELEVTETDIQSSPKAREVLEELRKMGVPVAIDDFGTGYSSLGSLKHLPVDCLKIDRTFIDTAGSTQDEILLGTIMSLGHALNFRIVAEGVEDPAQLQVLQGMDCDLVQGYYFSRPVSPAEVPEMARDGFKAKLPKLKGSAEIAAAAR
jgi:EAL domain-containing protein (putative c-di-GMP-specific phosphodiesterase class I)